MKKISEVQTLSRKVPHNIKVQNPFAFKIITQANPLETLV